MVDNSLGNFVLGGSALGLAQFVTSYKPIVTIESDEIKVTIRSE